MLQGTEDIRSHGAGGYVLQRFDQILHSWLPLRRKAGLVFSLIWTTTLLLFAFGTGIAFGVGYWLWSAGAITAGTVYLIFNYTEMIRQPIEQLRRQMEDLQRAGASITRVQELLRQRPKIREGRASLPSRAALQVEFQDVSFSYAENEIALSGIDFDLPAGKILGVLGRTGSGKSTMARLLLRLYEPDAGQICLDGVPLGTLRAAEVSRQVGLVPQEIQIFQASVRENLTIFDPSVPDERILRVIEDFGLKDWLQRLPSGLDSELARGGGLSAGESQLLNFARVALRDPGLVILDEATSRLDPATEALLDRATRKLLENRTGIIIAHRLQTVRRAGLIMILEQGRIVEYGERLRLAGDPGSRFSGLLRTGLEELLV
jgi:ATP-binding cassette subfamily B protein